MAVSGTGAQGATEDLRAIRSFGTKKSGETWRVIEG